jgi:hypothetical protein
MIEWKGRGGDQPKMEVDGTALEGVNASIEANDHQHGGTWFVLRGDMLRTPDTEPQASQYGEHYCKFHSALKFCI